MTITSPAVGDQATAAWADSVAAALNTRIGGRARTNATQTLVAAALTLMNNGGTAAWTAVEDSGGFASGTGGTTTPLSVPAGQAALYMVGFEVSFAAVATGRCFVQLMINGVGIKARMSTTSDDTLGLSVPVPLNVGDTIGVQVLHNLATTVTTVSDVFLYRIGA